MRGIATDGLEARNYAWQFALIGRAHPRFTATRVQMDVENALAAFRLSGAAPPAIIDLALDCRFESQEAFTRAFHRAESSEACSGRACARIRVTSVGVGR